MSKNKKGQFNTGPLSPEKYVRTQARTLPVEECLITDQWQNHGICNVIIARRHKTGNITIGLYLVDTYCLGLKDTSYRFNISPHELQYFKKNGGMIKCDYVLAHNIIYGGIAFAEDYGFKPHKDFAVTQFILEEDDEQVELIDIDFGLDGLPCYMRGPYDDDVKVRNIEATLLHNAGPGNYTIIDPPGDFTFDEDDDESFDNEQNPFLVPLKKLSKDYDEFLRPPEVKEMLSNSRIGMDYELTGEAMETEYTRSDSKEENEEYLCLYKMLSESKNTGVVIKKIKEAILKYPGKPLFYNLLQSAYIADSQQDNSDELVKEMHGRFPGYLFSKIAYANLLMGEDRLDEVLAVFDNKPDLNYLYPERHIFHKTEASAFFGTMCHYFIAVGNVDSADLYMNAILKYELIDMPNQTTVDKAIAALCKLKMEKLEEAGALNLDWDDVLGGF
jgi:hypothetical protein